MNVADVLQRWDNVRNEYRHLGARDTESRHAIYAVIESAKRGWKCPNMDADFWELFDGKDREIAAKRMAIVGYDIYRIFKDAYDLENSL